MRSVPILIAAAALAACTSSEGPQAVSQRPVMTFPPLVGLERVIGQDGAALQRLFGQPGAEFREGAARKLQFASPICVLDAYLYPQGTAEPHVTWLDARQPDGSPIDRASCVAALAHAQRQARVGPIGPPDRAR